MHGVDRREDLVPTRSNPVARRSRKPMTSATSDASRALRSCSPRVISSPLADTRAMAGLGEEHQRQQPGHLAIVGQEGTDQASEPYRFGGQVVPYGIRPGPVAR